MRLAGFYFLFLFGSPVFFAFGIDHAEWTNILTRVHQRVSDTMVESHIPGLSYTVGWKGKIVARGFFGYEDLSSQSPVGPRTLFHIASVSKTMTTVSVMKLVEEGRLDLDAQVQKYLPGFPVKPWPITVRQLLTHQAGIRHYLSNEIYVLTKHYEDAIQPVEIFQNDPLVRAPGTGFSYSSYGFNLLGAAVESAAGQSFVSWTEKVVLIPAGMKDTRVEDERVDIPHRARGYQYRSGTYSPLPFLNVSYKIPSGGYLSTSDDLVRMGLALEEDRLLLAATMKQMFAVQTDFPENRNMSLGWFRGTYKSTWVVNHSGGQPGFTAFLELVPEKKGVVAVLANAGGASIEKISREILNLVWENL